MTEIHDLLRASILRGELPPGEVISQVQMARELHVGRTPLREALRMLQREGLVESEFNRRVRVASFSLVDMEQIYALRIIVEAHAARVTVPLLAPSEIETLHAAFQEMVESAGVEDYERWELAHQRLHFGLSAHAGDRIRDQIHTLLDHAQRYRRLFVSGDPTSWPLGVEYYGGIVEACAERQAVQASRQLALQLGRAALTGVTYLDPGHDPAPLRAALRMVLGEDSALPGTWTGAQTSWTTPGGIRSRSRAAGPEA